MFIRGTPLFFGLCRGRAASFSCCRGAARIDLLFDVGPKEIKCDAMLSDDRSTIVSTVAKAYDR